MAIVLAVWEISVAFGAKRVAVPVIPLAVGALGMLVSAYVAGEEGLARIYAAAEARRRPVMIHTGTSIFPGARNRFACSACSICAIDFVCRTKSG